MTPFQQIGIPLEFLPHLPPKDAWRAITPSDLEAIRLAAYKAGMTEAAAEVAKLMDLQDSLALKFPDQAAVYNHCDDMLEVARSAILTARDAKEKLT